jgi:hypothetical protein
VESSPTSERISLEGRILWDAVRRASACSEVSLLCVARSRHLTFVALNGASLIVSWRYAIQQQARGAPVFLIPPMIVSHLLAALPQTTDAVDLTIDRDEARLTACDGVGSYELRWRFDLRSFPAPPVMSHLLACPSSLIQHSYLQIADSIHQAVAQLAGIESQQRIHRTRLAILVGMVGGRLAVQGQEILAQAEDEFYFDPRLLVRALECIRARQVEVGLNRLDSQHGYLSLVDRRRAFVMHCALLSIGQDTPWLPAVSPGRNRKVWLDQVSPWAL